ncbi:hypothetical protein HK099_001152 [Clydaea vesicula]|uniref:Uncharacterized protein n=1 Tax=Clydaea vesicula TaxID=447962 RepID=A0AAD5Y1C9_9FUNG|nr:hypothetical protein HK099_001152 [Clydaea vesicula]
MNFTRTFVRSYSSIIPPPISGMREIGKLTSKYPQAHPDLFAKMKNFYAKVPKGSRGAETGELSFTKLYYNKYIKTDSGAPILHILGIMIPLGYYIAYFKGGVSLLAYKENLETFDTVLKNKYLTNLEEKKKKKKMKILILFTLFLSTISRSADRIAEEIARTTPVPLNNSIIDANTTNSTLSSDCKILVSWLPTVFNKTDCCSSAVNLIPGTAGLLKHISCDSNGRVTSLNIGTPYWKTVLTNTALPKELGALNMLEYFALTDSNITGTIPEEYGNWKNLLGFYVFNNSLTGNIPNSFKNLRLLNEIDLTENKLSGQIDPFLFRYWTRLTGFWVDDNLFSGQIPKTLQNVLSLQGLGLSSNSFIGEFPNLRGLRFLSTGIGETWLNLGRGLDNTCQLEDLGDVCLPPEVDIPEACNFDENIRSKLKRLNII